MSQPKITGSQIFKEGWSEMISPNVYIDPASPPSSPDWETFRDGIKTYAFDDTTSQEAWWSTHMPHDWIVGTPVFPHVHWSHIDASPSGTVRWGIEYTMARGYNLDAFPATQTIYLNVDTTGSAQYEHFISEVSESAGSPANGPIDMSTMDIDGTMHFRIFRDADHSKDTFVGDAYVLFTDVHYQTDSSTTNERNYPFTKLT